MKKSDGRDTSLLSPTLKSVSTSFMVDQLVPSFYQRFSKRDIEIPLFRVFVQTNKICLSNGLGLPYIVVGESI